MQRLLGGCALLLIAVLTGCDEYRSAVPAWPAGTGTNYPALRGTWDVFGGDDGWWSAQPEARGAIPGMVFVPLDDTSYYLAWRGREQHGPERLWQDVAWHFRATGGVIGGVPLLQFQELAIEEKGGFALADPDTPYRFGRYRISDTGEVAIHLVKKAPFDAAGITPATPAALRGFLAEHIADPDLFEETPILRLRRMPVAPSESSEPADAPADAPAPPESPVTE